MKNQNLSHILRDGETVVWESRPQNIRMMEAPFHRSIIIQMICAVALVVFAVWYVLVSAPANAIPTSRAYILSAVLVLIGLYLAIHPMRTVQKLENSTHYYITNQRFIATYGSGLSLRVNYREFEDIHEALIDVTGKGRANIFIGPMNKEVFAHSRDMVHDYTKEEKNTAMVFYSVENAFSACDFFPSHIAISRCTSAVTAFNN